MNRKDTKRWNKKGEPYWTRERLIEAIQLWNKNHGAPPTTTDWHSAGDDHPCFSTLYRSAGGPFSSWVEALDAAGFEAGKGRAPVRKMLTRKQLKKRTREQRIADLRAALENQEGESG